MPVLALMEPEAATLGASDHVTAVQSTLAGGGPQAGPVVLEVTPVTLALKANCSPVPIEKLAGEMLTRTPESTVTVAVPTAVPTAAVTLIWVTVLSELRGTVTGAVYRPAVLIVPTVVLPPVTPFTAHVGVSEEPVTLGVNCRTPFARTVAVAGLTLTVTEVVVPQPTTAAPASSTPHTHRAQRLMPCPPRSRAHETFRSSSSGSCSKSPTHREAERAPRLEEIDALWIYQQAVQLRQNLRIIDAVANR